MRSNFRRLKEQAAFTILELMIASGFSLVVLTSVYGLFRTQSHSVKGQESRMEAHEYALMVLDVIVREIRNTGHFPTGAPCSTPANTAGIVTATAQSFQLAYDSNGDGSCEEDISFTYDSSTNNVLRNGSLLTDSNATNIQFLYYPQQTSGTAPMPFCFSTNNPSGCSGTLASNLGAVQKVTISITVRAKSTDTQFGGQSTITMSSTAELRNHGLPS